MTISTIRLAWKFIAIVYTPKDAEIDGRSRVGRPYNDDPANGFLDFMFYMRSGPTEPMEGLHVI